MPTASEKLVKILKLERDQSYKNTAVIGGLGAFAVNWLKEAHSQAKSEAHHLVADDIAQMMEQYDLLETRPERQEAVTYMLDRLMMRVPAREDFVPRRDWSAEEDDAPPADAPSASRAPAPTKPETRRERKSKAERLARDAERAPKREKPPKFAAAASDQPKAGAMIDEEGGHSAVEMEFEIAYVGTVEPDIPPEPRLARPPRIRRKMDAAQIADVDHAMQSSVEKIKGVGKRIAEMLAQLQINTLRDLLYYVPVRHDDYTRLVLLRHLQPSDSLVTVIGTVANGHIRAASGGRKDFVFTLEDGSGVEMLVTFFGQEWMRQKVRNGDPLVLSGRVGVYRNMLQMTNPEWEPLDAENLHTRGIVPIYRLTKGLSAKRMRTLMKTIVDYWTERLPDPLPEPLLERAELADLGWALRHRHFPEGNDHLQHAKRRLAFDALLEIQLALLANRRDWQAVRAAPLQADDDWFDRFLETVFPYPLTGAQQRALQDIRGDVSRDLPMNRLIQGDVGSGKTAVAIAALALAFVNDKQAALMAPTSILAEQHYRSVSEALEKMPGSIKPKVALLTGALPKPERDAVRAGLADGSIDVVIGTHALIMGGVEFFDLGLAIIDEQHRFGVQQRGALRGKGSNPHLLIMTATPIPRTLALTLHADLDLSIIDEMPPGRTPIRTTVRHPIEREHVYDFITSQLELGRQAFIVHPLVEASDKIEARSAVEAYEQLKEVFHHHRVGLLHGKMKPDEKDAAMIGFAQGQFDILVTTSVAEVGVNVPNASVMMIEGANRFGLSQLHQFRGRVGRGEHPGYCILVPDKNTPESLDRLAVMESTTDGFVLAEYDWKLRGAGDLLSVQQSGSSELQDAELMTPELVELAHREALTLYAEDPELSLPQHQRLRAKVQRRKDARSDVS